MAHSNNDFKVDAFDLADQVVQLRFSFWLENRFVKVKERICREGYF